MIGFPLVIAESERDMPGIRPGPLGWHTNALTTELQEVMRYTNSQHSFLQLFSIIVNLKRIAKTIQH